jgi:hypothetical protein
MNIQLRVGLLVAVAVVVGCAKKIVKPPSESSVTLAGKTATYRDWSRTTDLCSADPKLFGSDIESMNGMLTDFLAQTGAEPSEDVVKLLEQGHSELPAALASTRSSIEKAKRAKCKFPDFSKVLDLSAQAEKRLSEAPAVMAGVKYKKALAEWKTGQGAALAAAEEKCPVKPKPNAKPEIMYAFQDENGKMEWMFCDNSKVETPKGGSPAYVAPTAAIKGYKKAKPQEYIDAAAKYAEDKINRAPQANKE